MTRVAPITNSTCEKSNELLNKIISGGYCVGCGACHNATNGAIPIVLDRFGQYQADPSCISSLSDELNIKACDVCPFSDSGNHETAIAAALYGQKSNHDTSIGYHNGLYAGYVDEGDVRSRGSSGGLIRWILCELFKENAIDAVAHVKKTGRNDKGILFKYGLSHNAADVLSGVKSCYYPVEMSEVLSLIKEQPGRYAIVGLPCFIKAVRRLQRIDPVFKTRIVYCIGLVCGHLKSKGYADCLAWQMGIPPGTLDHIDFRLKLPGESAEQYGVHVEGAGTCEERKARDLLGTHWGHNLFRYSACNYCDDVFAETADVTVGDAWLPAYVDDYRGTSIVVIRNKTLGEIIDKARHDGRLQLDDCTPEAICTSQAGGLRDRCEGLAYRLHLSHRKRQWVPTKRIVPACRTIPRHRRTIYRLRMQLGTQSHFWWLKAVEANSFLVFMKLYRNALSANSRQITRLPIRTAAYVGRLVKQILRDTKDTKPS